jgi:hypothetical protein
MELDACTFMLFLILSLGLSPQAYQVICRLLQQGKQGKSVQVIDEG